MLLGIVVKNIKIVTGIFACVLALSLSGCANTAETKVEKKAKPSVEKIWPLTGEKASSGDDIARPALSMKIENIDDARPHVGLDKADIVWEQMVEGGLVRFNAVFHSDLPEKAGPMRSVRPMDADISAPLKGVFACSGGQLPFKQSVSEVVGKLIDEDGAGSTAMRSSDRPVPHNLFLNVKEALAEFGKGLNAPSRQLDFADGKKNKLFVDAKGSDAKPANNLVLDYPAHNAKWDFDASSKEYLRSDNGSALVTEDGVRIASNNIVVMDVNVKPNSFDAHVPQTILVGEGKARFLTNGKYVEGTWSKKNIDSPVIFKDLKGRRINFAPGKTWIELLPVTSSFEIG